MIFPEPLFEALRSRPDRPAFEHGSRTISRGEVLETVGRMASGLRAAGLGRGRGVAMLPALSPEAFAANLAAHALGCRVVAVRPGWSAPQLSGVLSAAQVDAVVLDPLSVMPGEPVRGLSLDELMEGTDDGPPVSAEGRPDDIARLSFTSGSTGRPKGCASTYRSYGLAYRPDRWAPPVARLMSHFDRCLVFGSWSMPVMMTFAGRTLMVGGTVIVPVGDPRPPLRQAIERHQITATFSTPPMLARLLDPLRDHPGDPGDLGSLRALVISGSPASPQRLAEAVERLGPVIWQGYGQGESGMISLLTPEDLTERSEAALTSVGRPLPTVGVSVRDADGRQVGRGETGRIHVRSPHLMAGYWGDRRQTEEVLRDGWLNTQDLGHLDDQGYLHLTGRSREVILVNAQVRYAGPIERVLAGHQDVDQACVVGAPDEQTGEAIHAFVVPAAGGSPSDQDLESLVRAELGPGSVPKTITILPEVPVTAAGKPDKRALLARIGAEVVGT